MSNYRRISGSDLKATPGNFRSVALIDSEYYQINGDDPSLELAQVTCGLEPEGTLVQIYDDKGEPQIKHKS